MICLPSLESPLVAAKFQRSKRLAEQSRSTAFQFKINYVRSYSQQTLSEHAEIDS